MIPAPWIPAVRADTPRAGPSGPVSYSLPAFGLWWPSWRTPWGGVHRGELDPRAASAMASLAGALVRTITAGELEERLRALEDRGGEKVSS